MKEMRNYRHIIAIAISTCLLLTPNHLMAKKHDAKNIDFVNNPALLSNSFGEYKGIKLSVKDKRIISKECAELMNKDNALYEKCRAFYKNLAISFKVDEMLCRKKAKRLASISKNRQLTLIDENGNLKYFTINNYPFSESAEYESCMEIMKWKDSREFRYGRY